MQADSAHNNVIKVFQLDLYTIMTAPVYETDRSSGQVFIRWQQEAKKRFRGFEAPDGVLPLPGKGG